MKEKDVGSSKVNFVEKTEEGFTFSVAGFKEKNEENHLEQKAQTDRKLSQANPEEIVIVQENLDDDQEYSMKKREAKEQRKKFHTLDLILDPRKEPKE